MKKSIALGKGLGVKDIHESLIEQNRQWVAEKLSIDGAFFETLAKGQTPKCMFVGCADSRQPINILTKTGPGDLFIARNVANQVSSKDDNGMAAIEFAVEKLEVLSIVIFGHHRCGGVKAAMGETLPKGAIGRWIAPIKELYTEHKAMIEGSGTLLEQENALAELNVIQQVKNLCLSDVMRAGFELGAYPRVHGWIFEMETGLIQALELPISAWKTAGILPRDY